MTTQDDGGRAFPDPHSAFEHGMTLRDYFAAAALSSMSAPFAPKETAAVRAAAAYSLADAMLAERKKVKSDE